MTFDFDARAFNPTQPLEAVPEGWYLMALSKFEMSATKDKHSGQEDGGALVCWFEIFQDNQNSTQFKGRQLRKQFNLWNKNEKTVEIAQRDLSAICYVTGQFVLSAAAGGPSALVGKPFYGKVIKQTDARYNDIVGYKDVNGNDPKSATAGAAPQQAAIPPAQAPTQQQAPAPMQQQQPPQQPAYSAPVAAPLPQQATGFGGPGAAPQGGGFAGGAPAAGAFGGGAPAPMAQPPAQAPAVPAQGGFQPPAGGGFGAPGAGGAVARPW